MGYMRQHYPELCTDGGGIDVAAFPRDKYPTAQHVARFVYEQTKHLFPEGATVVYPLDKEAERRWLE